MLNKHFTIFALTLALLLSGCNAESLSLDSSAQVWVEYPYEGSILPNAPLTIVVYAADPGGISYIHIQVNGQSLPAYAASPMTTDGSARLVRIDYPWTPPGEGEYFVKASGVNSAGAAGGSSATRFCVVTCATTAATSTPAPGDTATPAPGDTPTSAPGPTDTPIPFITLPPLSPTWTPPSPVTLTPVAPGITVEFFGDPSSVNAGNCYTLHWDVTGTDQVYLDGAYVYAHGMDERCPCETESHTLRVVSPDGTSQDYYARIDVYGSCTPPTTEPPPPPSDTTGPSINSFSVFWNGCSLYGAADVSDPSGVYDVEFWYNLNDAGWNIIAMSQSGTEWTSQVGVETSGFAGSLQYKIHAVDSLGNQSWSGVGTKNFSYCGD
ncbi:MAG: hypothetical protein Fur0043_06280 [Anaerolineales bacterium]